MPLQVKSPLFLASLGSLIFGFLVLAFPDLLAYLVAVIFIILGIVGLYYQMKRESQAPGP